MAAHAGDLRHLHGALYGLAPEDRHKAVVITHHLPSPKAIAPHFKNLPNGEFASDLDFLINDAKPALWVFGHSHTRTFVTVNCTALVGHPLGYKKNELQSGPDLQYTPRLVRVF